MKKVFISCGHGGSDPGAVKYIVEKEYTLRTGLELANILKSAGVDVLMSRTTDTETDLNEKVRRCNAYNPDLVIDVHFNAGGGAGFEIYHSRVGGTGKTLAENIDAEMRKIMKSRGVKTKIGSGGKDYFAIIRDTNAPAVLCEGGFVDDKEDAEFIRTHYKAIARAYSTGILKTLNIAMPEEKTEEKPTENDVLYRVQVGTFKKKENAEALVKRLKTAGYADAFITTSK
jgi:N-acetylmuramoyl-L-alanine amidase